MEENTSRTERKRKQSSFTRLKDKRRKVAASFDRIGARKPIRRPLIVYGSVVLGLVVLYTVTLFLTTDSLSRGETFKTTNRYKTLQIDAPNATVNFVRSTDGNVQLKLVDSASSQKRLKIGTSGNTLTVTGRDGFAARLGNRPSEQPGAYAIQVGLPSYMNRVDVDAETLKGMGVFAKTIEMTAKSMDLNKVDADDVSLTGRGNIKVENMNAVHADVTAESVNLSDYGAKLDLSVSTIDGAIRLKPTKAAGTIAVTTDGDIKANDRYTKQKDEDVALFELSKQEKPEVTVESEVGQVTLE
ncbi:MULTISPECIES: DUF4097 family beta strand repeat-containing protein [Exiguobacterium]|uniref:DUF4097 family beta strand repeat-containing protein n=1 Tax=Exiguobacterium antarcticum TaxID=132920 RepID=A0ABT6QYP1_9BACL|nr:MULTISPECIES: DUF4097 family beta strand repeat-containing protein [Exiguobacterium]AFS70891.1 Hypothetical protein Eab7_1783 [Exiguobacterium antarcticum B7]MCT4779067.1 DUF4097 domain-containing protein [Exiguobacterium soli]MDI3233795.1 DUF4097 family beta strand repeat-containing protein [Exiguobacterium antarcticum]